jgi:hypothetical protein
MRAPLLFSRDWLSWEKAGAEAQAAGTRIRIANINARTSVTFNIFLASSTPLAVEVRLSSFIRLSLVLFPFKKRGTRLRILMVDALLWEYSFCLPVTAKCALCSFWVKSQCFCRSE